MELQNKVQNEPKNKQKLQNDQMSKKKKKSFCIIVIVNLRNVLKLTNPSHKSHTSFYH